MAKSSLEISIGVESSQVKTGLAAVRDQFREASSNITTALSNIKGFTDLKKQTREVAIACKDAQQQVRVLAGKVKEAGDIDALEKSFRKAKKAAATLKDEVSLGTTAYARARAVVAEINKKIKAGDESLGNALEQATREAEELEANLNATKKSYREAKDVASDFRGQVKAATTVHREFAVAEKHVAGLKRTYADQRQELLRMRTSLQDAGISTTDLGSAQKKLQTELVKTRAKFQTLAEVANARETLGVEAHTDIQRKIAQTREAYVTLKKSGKASMRELAQAKVAMGRRIDELRAKTNGWKEQLVAARFEIAKVAAAAAGLVKSAGIAIRFESSMADVKKTVGGTKDEIRELGNEIRQMSYTIPTAADDLAKIAATGGQLGIASQDIGKFTEVTSKMATAFDMSAEAAGDSIGKIKNVYQLTIPEVEGLGDAVNQLGNTTAARERDIINVMLRVGGTAKQFGLADEAIAALSASMLSLGRPAEVSGTAINAMLNRMQTANMQSGEFKDALLRIGTSADEMAAMVAADPQAALDGLLETLAKLGDQERAEVLTGLFGKEFQDDVGVLVGSLDTYRDAMSQVADKTRYAGAMNDEFRARSETTENQLQLLMNIVVDMTRSIGDGFLPAIDAVAGGLNAILRPVARLMSEFPKLSATLASVATGFVVFRSAKRLVDILRLAITKIGPTSIQSFATAGTAATGFGSKLTPVISKATRFSGVISKANGILTAFGVGWAIGEILNKFKIIRKAGATLIHALDRVRLAAKKMWRVLTGGDVGEVDRQIAAANAGYKDLLADIDKDRDDWAKKQRGEAAGSVRPAPSEKKDESDTPPKKEEDPDAAFKKEMAEEDKKWEQEAIDTWDDASLNEEQLADRNRRRKEGTFKGPLSKEEQERIHEQQQAEKKRKEKEDEEEKREEKEDEERKRKQALKAQAEDKKRKEKEDEELFRMLKKPSLGKKSSGEKKRKRDKDETKDRRSVRVQMPDASQSPEKSVKERLREEAARAEKLLGEKKTQDAIAVLHEDGSAHQEKMIDDVTDAHKKAMAARTENEKRATEQAKSVFEKYAEKVKAISDDMAARGKTLQDDLTTLDPKASEETKWRNRAKQAREYEKAARAAMKAGDLRGALALSDQAADAYKNLKGGADGINKKLAANTVYSGVKSTGELSLAIEKLMADALGKQATVDLGSAGDAIARAAGQIQPGTGGGDQREVKKVVELKFKGGSLQGSQGDVDALLRQLEQAGLSA